MKAIFYKDKKYSAFMLAFIGLINVAVSVFMIIDKKMFWNWVLWGTMMMFTFPTGSTFSDKREHSEEMYGALPIKKTDRVTLRFLYIPVLLLFCSLLFQAVAAAVNSEGGHSLFNMNNLVTESAIMLLAAMSSVWLMLVFLLKNSNISFIIVCITLGMLGGFVGFFSEHENLYFIDFAQPHKSTELEFLFRTNFHIVFWCVCLLVTIASFAVTYIIIKKKQ